MIMMGSCLTSLGARHGLSLQPQNRCAALVRCARHTENKFQLKIGLRIAGDVYYAPFCEESAANPFGFCDEKLGVADAEYRFVAEKYGVIVTLRHIVPFRPKDEAFSTVPTALFSVEVKNIRGNFRWCERSIKQATGEVFVSFDTNFFQIGAQAQKLRLTYDHVTENKRDFYAKIERECVRQADLIDVLCGEVSPSGEICGKFSLARGSECEAIGFTWNSFLPDAFSYFGKRCPFAYRDRFSSLEEVAAYARSHRAEIADNAARQNKKFLGSDFGPSFDKLLCLSLHSYLMNTWLVKSGDRHLFFVWEGNCYFNSTVDVEFTQAPFYLALFPSLLKYQLDMWPEFAKTCEEGTFLCHDTGELCTADGQHYPHDMPVEESADYIILLYLYACATGDTAALEEHFEFVEELLKFLRNCCNGAGGLPALHTANTLDDASSAMQYGKEQVYLGMKVAAAFDCGARICKKLKRRSGDRKRSRRIVRRIEKRGFGGHYYVALNDDNDGVFDTWSNRPLEGKIPGVRASHIYTLNAYALTSLAGVPCPISRRRAVLDLKKACRETMQTYGCRHTSYLSELETDMAAGLAGNSPKCGWISMNILRDAAALRLGVDMRGNLQRYWDWMETVNDQEFCMFMETFAGNNLHFYPRGVALFGLFSAARGVRWKDGKLRFKKTKGNYPLIEEED